MNTKIEVIQGDITTLQVDAIVNAANSSLMGGGGVDGAIHRAGGPAILEACKKIIAHQGRCQTGQAVITIAGNLPANYVIHTVGPVWSGGIDDAKLLQNCYLNSLRLAIEHQCRSLAFPNISTGVYGYPKDQAAQVAVRTVFEFVGKNPSLQLVQFCCFDAENFTLCNQVLQTLINS